jgi:hypothetical protein
LTTHSKADKLPVTVEQRKTRRFKLQLPVSVIRAGNSRLADAGFTRDISSCGVLFTAAHALEPGGPIEYIITLSDERPHPVSLKCVGTVVRQEPLDGGAAVAATVERYEFLRTKPE